MSYLNRNRLKNFFVNLKKYFKSEEFLNSMAISNAEIDNIANTAGYNDNGTGTVNYDFVPRSGGGVITGNSLGRTVDDSFLRLNGGSGYDSGSSMLLTGKDYYNGAGNVFFHLTNGSNEKDMYMYPDGSWTWNGSAVQITSDQRYKQQINAIDDKLLDAWKDVAPVQFKYNDAVEEKGDNARLHTGYVVQQIAEACQNNDVDIDNYGLYCHEVYPERTEEVTITNEDGTTKKETKVIEPAKEHYSLRYTEALIVECAFLRREVERLTERVTKLESRKKKTTS